jgi:hypothetical protein
MAREDARIVVAEQVHALRQLPYGALRAKGFAAPEIERVSGLEGQPLRRETRVAVWGEGPDEQVLIVVRVCRDTRLGRLRALAEDLVVATPDGRMVRHASLSQVPRPGR